MGGVVRLHLLGVAAEGWEGQGGGAVEGTRTAGQGVQQTRCAGPSPSLFKGEGGQGQREPELERDGVMAEYWAA